MVQVKRKEIEKAFRSHKHFVEIYCHSTAFTYKMLLFYAVECGLKALYMRKNGLKRTDEQNNLKESAASFGHNINTLLGKLNMNIKVPKGITKDNSQVESGNLHEAWRYGRALDSQKEAKCIEALKAVFYEIKLKLS